MNKKGNILLIILVVVVILAASVGGYFWFKTQKTKNESMRTVEIGLIDKIFHLPSTYNECVKFPGSKIERGYEGKCAIPNECITFSGKRFVESSFKEKLTNFHLTNLSTNWKTYVDKARGIGFKYPEDGKVVPNKQYEDLFKLDYPKSKYGIDFRIIANGQNLKNYIFSDSSYGNYAVPPEIYDLQTPNASGYRFLSFIPENGCYDVTYLRARNENTAVEIMTPALDYDGNEDIYNQILSTFKFIQ